MFSKLFTASDGKIPYVPILLGVVIGAIGMLVYAKFWRPKILFEDSEMSTNVVKKAKVTQNKMTPEKAEVIVQEQTVRNPEKVVNDPATMMAAQMGVPFIDIHAIRTQPREMRMPTLPIIDEDDEEEPNEADTDDEYDEEEEQEGQAN